MPTREQMAAAPTHIKDVIGRNYVEGDGDMCSCWFQPEGGGPVGRTMFQGAPVGVPEPFAELLSRAKVNCSLPALIGKGSATRRTGCVIDGVIDGEGPDFGRMASSRMAWKTPPGSGSSKFCLSSAGGQPPAIAEESVQKYGKFFKESKERALSRMQGMVKEQER